MKLRNWIAATVLVLGAMCMTATVVHADVGLDPFVTVDHVAPADFPIDVTTSVDDPTNYFHFGSGSIVADLPGSGGDDEPIAAFCSVAPRLLAGDPMRIDDPGWCLT